MQFILKRFQDAGQDTLGIGQEQTVVNDWNSGLKGLMDAAEHLPAVNHTGTAVDDEGILIQIIGIMVAAAVLNV